jgi:hypothetical protein
MRNFKNDHLKIRVVNLMKIRRWDVWTWWKNEQSDENLIKMRTHDEIQSEHDENQSIWVIQISYDWVRVLRYDLIYQSTSSSSMFLSFQLHRRDGLL